MRPVYANATIAAPNSACLRAMLSVLMDQWEGDYLTPHRLAHIAVGAALDLSQYGIGWTVTIDPLHAKDFA